MRSAIAIILLVLISLGTASAAWRAPHGIYVTFDPTTDYGTNPGVQGKRQAATWGNIETSEGVCDFTALDAAVTANDGFGKQLTFSMVTLDAAPAWLLAKPGVTGYVTTYKGGPVTLVLPWDPIVQPYLLDYIRMFCQHFDGKIDGVQIGGIGMEVETYFPVPTDTTPNIPLSIDDEIAAWVASSNLVIDTYAAYLKSCPFIMAGGIPFSGGAGTTAITSVFNHGRNYGVHFGVMQWGLQANSNTGYLVNGWINDYSPFHPAGFQFTGNSEGTSGGALNGTLLDVLHAGAALHAQFIEVYGTDTQQTVYKGTLKLFSGALAPTPAGQLGPMRSRRILCLRKRT